MAENRRWCAPAPDHSPAYNRDLVAGDPNGTRTRVFAVKGRRPRPLDDGAVRLRPGPLSRMDGARSSTLLRLLFHALQSAHAASSSCISACRLVPPSSRFTPPATQSLPPPPPTSPP